MRLYFLLKKKDICLHQVAFSEGKLLWSPSEWRFYTSSVAHHMLTAISLLRPPGHSDSELRRCVCITHYRSSSNNTLQRTNSFACWPGYYMTNKFVMRSCGRASVRQKYLFWKHLARFYITYQRYFLHGSLWKIGQIIPAELLLLRKNIKQYSCLKTLSQGAVSVKYPRYFLSKSS